MGLGVWVGVGKVITKSKELKDEKDQSVGWVAHMTLKSAKER